MSTPTPILGAGQSPFGSIHAGYGTPSSINSSTKKLWLKSDGTQGNAALISQTTGDYVLDEDGNSLGTDSINQMIFLALATVRNSSAVDNFGLDVDIRNGTINQSTLPKVKLAVQQALNHLTTPKVITLLNTTITRISSSAIQINVQWKDNSTGQINVFTF